MPKKRKHIAFGMMRYIGQSGPPYRLVDRMLICDVARVCLIKTGVTATNVRSNQFIRNGSRKPIGNSNYGYTGQHHENAARIRGGVCGPR